jgi:hypothetical protein
MFRPSLLLAVICGLGAVGQIGAQLDSVKLPTFSGTVMTDEFKIQGGTFLVIDDKGERRTFEYNTPKAPRCAFYDIKAGRNLKPHEMGLGDEVTVAYTQEKDKVYAVKVTRKKAARHD